MWGLCTVSFQTPAPPPPPVSCYRVVCSGRGACRVRACPTVLAPLLSVPRAFSGFSRPGAGLGPGLSQAVNTWGPWAQVA